MGWFSGNEEIHQCPTELYVTVKYFPERTGLFPYRWCITSEAFDATHVDCYWYDKKTGRVKTLSDGLCDTEEQALATAADIAAKMKTAGGAYTQYKA